MDTPVDVSAMKMVYSHSVKNGAKSEDGDVWRRRQRRRWSVLSCAICWTAPSEVVNGFTASSSCPTGRRSVARRHGSALVRSAHSFTGERRSSSVRPRSTRSTTSRLLCTSTRSSHSPSVRLTDWKRSSLRWFSLSGRTSSDTGNDCATKLNAELLSSVSKRHHGTRIRRVLTLLRWPRP